MHLLRFQTSNPKVSWLSPKHPPISSRFRILFLILSYPTTFVYPLSYLKIIAQDKYQKTRSICLSTWYKPEPVRGLLQPLLGCASHDQRYPSGRIDNGQTVFLTSPGAPVKGLKIGVYGCNLVVVLGPLEMARQGTR